MARAAKTKQNVVEKALGRHATLSVVKGGETTQTQGKVQKFSGELAVVRV